MKTKILLILMLFLLPYEQPVQAREIEQRVYLPLVVMPEVSPLPMVNEIVNNGDGTCTAWWGYDNPNSYSFTITLEEYNLFWPLPDERGQVTYFLPGIHTSVFSTTWSNGENLSWTVNEYTATAHWFTCLYPFDP